MSCEQRRLRMLYNIPPARITPISPYLDGKYTQQQLDMRRKVEILKYSPNKSSTQTNNLTRSEKWSKIANGNKNRSYCPADDYLPTLTSSCDVPGPIMYLINDKTVPLYNYATNVDAYAIQPTETLADKWTITNYADVTCSTGKDVTIASIYLLNQIDKPDYIYTITTPFAIYIKGTNVDLSSNKTISIHIDTITSTVYHGGNEIMYPNGSPICKLNGNLVSSSNTFTMDLSLSNATTPYSFSAYVYAGMLTISNIHLSTLMGFGYDIRLQFNLNMVISPTVLTSLQPEYGAYCNLTPNKFNIGKTNENCLVKSAVSTISYSTFSMSGQ